MATVRVEDDTTQWGTKTDSWLEMALEEIDDLAIYVVAQSAREVKQYMRRERKGLDATAYNKLMDALADVRTQIVDLMENTG